MFLIERLNKGVFIIIEVALIFIIGIVHVVFRYLIKETEFSVFDLFDSSPLFGFELKNDCGNMSALSLHKWGGILLEDFDSDGKIIYNEGKTDIKKVNGKYFCYKHISYINLLNNGQIIKNESECPSEFPKNCGKLDTLEQELCIKENEKCPLYDLGIGNKSDDDNYIYDEYSNIYYNNDNYTKKNKTIIGRLILNDGQPCYNSLEKLWKKFNPEEAEETHLKCDIEVYGKYNDDRYKNKGNISYKRLYEDNLNQICKDMILNYLSDKENVSLYQREFLGINKECDKNFILTKDSFDTIHDSENSIKILLLIEGCFFAIISFLFLFLIILFFCLDCTEDEDDTIGKMNIYYYLICMAMLIPSIICHIVFYYRIKNNNLDGYDCSDPITNELIKKGYEHNSKQILFIKINVYLDLILGAINCLVWLISLVLLVINKIIEKCCEKEDRKKQSQGLDYEKVDNKGNSGQNNTEIPLNTYYPEKK